MILDREELIRKYRAVQTAEAQFIALCIEQYHPSTAEPTNAFKVSADHFGMNKAANDNSPSPEQTK